MQKSFAITINRPTVRDNSKKRGSAAARQRDSAAARRRWSAGELSAGVVGHNPDPASAAGRCRTVADVTGGLHHVELWVPDFGRAVAEWGWLLGRLGYETFQDWPAGRSWRLGDTYLVVEQSPALTGAEHDRCRPGLNHLAFHAGTRPDVDSLAADGPAHAWTLLFADC